MSHLLLNVVILIDWGKQAQETAEGTLLLLVEAMYHNLFTA